MRATPPYPQRVFMQQRPSSRTGRAGILRPGAAGDGREPQGQGGLDGEIRVPPLPAPPGTPAGRPGSDRLRGHPHRHIAASNEGLIVGRPVRHPTLRLIPGMNLRLHPRSVAPAEGPEKCGPRRPPAAGIHATTPRPHAPCSPVSPPLYRSWQMGRRKWHGRLRSPEIPP